MLMIAASTAIPDREVLPPRICAPTGSRHSRRSNRDLVLGEQAIRTVMESLVRELSRKRWASSWQSRFP